MGALLSPEKECRRLPFGKPPPFTPNPRACDDPRLLAITPVGPADDEPHGPCRLVQKRHTSQSLFRQDGANGRGIVTIASRNNHPGNRQEPETPSFASR